MFSDTQSVRFLFDVFLAICVGVGAIYSFVVGRDRAKREEINALADRLDTCDDRLIAAETRLQNVPSSADIATLFARLQGMDERLVAVQSQLTTINDFLLRGGK